MWLTMYLARKNVSSSSCSRYTHSLLRDLNTTNIRDIANKFPHISI